MPPPPHPHPHPHPQGDAGPGVRAHPTPVTAERPAAAGDDVYVVTGAGSGIGLATARLLRDHRVIAAGRTASTLTSAVAELRAAGVRAEQVVCDVADADGVRALARTAGATGPVRAVIHAAGQSPRMGSAAQLLAVNAIGTLHVHDAFLDVLAPGGVVVDVSSVAAHLLPGAVMPRWLYPLARTDPARFRRRILGLIRLVPEARRSGIAYVIAKDYVIWLARTDAARFGRRGCRVMSVSPGNVDTRMAVLEADDTRAFLPHQAIQRYAHPDEIARLLVFLASDACEFLTGADILCDGGLVASGMSPLDLLRRSR